FAIHEGLVEDDDIGSAVRGAIAPGALLLAGKDDEQRGLPGWAVSKLQGQGTLGSNERIIRYNEESQGSIRIRKALGDGLCSASHFYTGYERQTPVPGQLRRREVFKVALFIQHKACGGTTLRIHRIARQLDCAAERLFAAVRQKDLILIGLSRAGPGFGDEA